MPDAPAGLRGGGSTSAGMISTVHTPLPILAETAPKICPHFCAPSPESDTTSTARSLTVRTDTLRSARALAPTVGSFIAILPPVRRGSVMYAASRLLAHAEGIGTGLGGVSGGDGAGGWGFP